ncbi:uncharacterized protein LOC105628466 [Jatropha curcas]|uniref:uncharacterized protein LOC105628466 n=1 Tax=Jatropha curcas TaxID=180498 RepID=UPI0005FAB7E9|nr:uncharacterized protein LOC105628466 [Jatropha curcas]
MKIPPKATNFIWCAVRNVLPCKRNLCSRKVDIQDICPLCLGHSETNLHIIVNCPFPRQVWTLFHLGFWWYSAMFFGEWFQQTSNSLTLEHLSYVSMVRLALWITRNDIVWRQKSRNPGAIILLATGVWHAWKEAKFHGLVVPSPANSNRTWSPPPFNWIKVNTDASIGVVSGYVGIGTVVRNLAYEFIAGKEWRFLGFFNAKVAEVIAVRETLSWIKDHG